MRDHEKYKPGSFFLKDGEIWKVISYCALPTVTMEKVSLKFPAVTPTRIGGAVGSPNINEFTKLVPEE